MADLSPLIRVRRHVVEQKQKMLAELYRQAEELENQKNKIVAQLDEERRKVQEMGVGMLSYFGTYVEAAKKKIADLKKSIGKLETRIDIAREDMREAFSELKKIEITQERREDEEQKEIDKKESADLDEIGIETFRRKQGE